MWLKVQVRVRAVTVMHAQIAPVEYQLTFVNVGTMSGKQITARLCGKWMSHITHMNASCYILDAQEEVEL